jgi:hypothetical protein
MNPIDEKCLNRHQKLILDGIKRVERGEKIYLYHRPRSNNERFYNQIYAALSKLLVK